jgi:hypothetical protein
MKLEQELEYFESIKEDLLEHYENKFALIKGQELVNTFTTWEEAFKAGTDRFGNVPFLIKLVQEKDESVQLPAFVVGAISVNP